MTIDFCNHDNLHHLGDSATRPIEPRCGALAALLLLAGMSLRRRRALPAHRITARSGASNCRSQDYKDRELVPGDMLEDLGRAKIVIINFHAFRLRDRIELSKGGRQLLKGRTGDELQTKETEGQMIQRVMPDLMGMKSILVPNDEAHHCYREKPADDADFTDGQGNPLAGPELTEAKARAKKENEAARLWISGLEAVNRKLGLARVIDLSATPFFLSGSGYAEGTLFPWTMSDF